MAGYTFHCELKFKNEKFSLISGNMLYFCILEQSIIRILPIELECYFAMRVSFACYRIFMLTTFSIERELMKCFFVTVVNCNRAEWYTELWFRWVPEQHGSFLYVHIRVVTRQQSFDSCPVFCRFAQISRCEFDLHWDRVSTKGEDSSQRWRVTSGKLYWVFVILKKKQWIRFTPLPKRL